MLDELFDHLKTDDFQDPEGGLLTFPAYLYVYPPEQEYAFRDEVEALAERLRRPPAHQDPLVIDLYELFVEILETESIGSRSLLEVVQQEEAKDKARTDRLIRRYLDRHLLDAVNERVASHMEQEDEMRRTYVFVHGWGRLFPYLRASTFLSRMEDHVRGYKLILFYPGTFEGGQLEFLGRIRSSGLYRATILNEQIRA